MRSRNVAGSAFNCSTVHSSVLSSVLCILHPTTDTKIENPFHNFVLSQDGFQDVEKLIQASHSN